MQEQSNTTSLYPYQPLPYDQEIKAIAHLINLTDANINKERGIQNRQVNVARNHIWIASLLAVLSFTLFDRVVSGHAIHDLTAIGLLTIIGLVFATVALLFSFVCSLKVTWPSVDFDYTDTITHPFEVQQTETETDYGTVKEVTLAGFRRYPANIFEDYVSVLQCASNCHRRLCAQSVKRGSLLICSGVSLYVALGLLMCCLLLYLVKIL